MCRFIWIVGMTALLGLALGCKEKDPEPIPKDPKAPAKRFPSPDADKKT